MMTNSPLINIVYIKDLTIYCIIGLNADERVNEQEILVNISLYVDCDEFGKQDNLAGSVDYSKLSKEITNLVKKTKSYTVEYLAEQVAILCLTKQFVKRVRVSIEKPAALNNAGAAGVEIERYRKINS